MMKIPRPIIDTSECRTGIPGTDRSRRGEER
jgi:hypothetical protein